MPRQASKSVKDLEGNMASLESTKENSNKMRFVDLESIRGQMVNSMRGSGAIIKCMEKVP